jgi:hypothetical protein
VLLDVSYALITEGMTTEQREEFDRLVIEKTSDSSSSSTTGAEMAQRRAYALTQGEIG